VASLIKQWSTDSVAERQRLGFWMDSICESFLEMKAQPVGDASFYGSIEQSALDEIMINEVRGSPQEVRRDRLATSRSSADYYYLITQLGSPWSVHHAGHESQLQPGDSVLIDSRLTYEFGFPGGLHNLSIQMPMTWVHRWLPDPDSAIGRRIDGSQGWGAALRAYKEALTPQFAVNPGLPKALLSEQLGSLMSLAYGAVPVAQSPLNGAYQRCVKKMHECLEDTNLVASVVAKDCAISLRSLHRAFAIEGKTFASVLLEMRLTQAERMLGDHRFAKLTIADVASRCGYAEPSHFAKQFSQRSGKTPGLYRSLSFAIK
jgi:AraC family transcriptional regulator, positive regulator of tynA and feaB